MEGSRCRRRTCSTRPFASLPLGAGFPWRAPRLNPFVNRLNQEGVTVYRRLSPRVLIEMLRAAGEDARFHESLVPFAPAAWLAALPPGITSADLYHPVLDRFMRGLPTCIAISDAPVGAGRRSSRSA